MKLTVYLRGLLMIFLLPGWTLSLGEYVDIDTLARIINFIEQNYKRLDVDGHTRQYATAINVPKSQCLKGFYPSRKNFLTQENANNVKNVIGDETNSLYEGKQLIAAGTKRRVKANYHTHSEYLLLKPANNSPMKKLLDTNNQNCSIFYTFNSPCFGTCLNEKGKYNIVDALDNWSKRSGIKAFVFRELWRHDSNKDLKSKFKLIAFRVPLYRCEKKTCYACKGEGNTPIDENCLPPKTKPSNIITRNEF